ncbi:MAG: hypothetical protein COA97_12825 [Flavobacteriales bacterium]|nr:MAG: hypothetical protein COA97_12825 [Flavobacteriales bacterium]
MTQQPTNKTSPTLRFPEFSGEWEEKRLDEVSEINRGKSKHRPRNAKKLYGGKYPFVQTGDIREASLYLDSYSQTYSEEGLKQSKLWDIDTLCITIAANIAETAILKIKACFPDSIIGLIPYEKETTVLFVKHQFDKFKIDIQRLSQGVAQDNLNKEKLSKIEFKFPTLPEQQKIAAFLTAVDAKIAQLNKKKSLLEQYKKGVMQHLFSSCHPEPVEGKGRKKLGFRFKDKNGNHYPDWEEKMLGEVAVKKSSNISANTIEENKGKYKIYGASGLLKTIDFYREETEYISIVKDGAGVGRTLLCEAFSSVLGTLEVIKPKIDANLYFIYSLINNIDFNKYITGSTIPHIYFKDYSKEKINIPCSEEQTKIANFLSSLDAKIELVTIQLESTQQFKKGLLQQLFV